MNGNGETSKNPATKKVEQYSIICHRPGVTNAQNAEHAPLSALFIR